MISVLYVDDDPALLESGKLFLERTGQFSVDIITSAQDALSLLKSKDYDGILSDYQMPEMDGIEFLKKVRISGNTIPVIIFTERGQEEVVVEAINNGGDFYLKTGICPETQFFELAHKIQIAVEHRQTLEKILSLNRLYSVLSASNKAIVHLRTKDEFFSEICRILVETGGFRMAWIGLADTEYKIIRPIISAGQINGYLDNIHISTEDIPSGQGPTGTAYREGSYFFSNDIARDPRMKLWRENALNHGYLASAAFPFALGTKNAGILTIYAPVTGFFDDRTVTLLEELSGAISFALEALDQIEHRISAEKELKKSELKYRRLFQTARDGILIIDGDTGEITDANASILDMSGYPREYFVGRHLWDLGFLKNESLTKNAFVKLKTGNYVQHEELLLKTKQGTNISVEVVSNGYFMDNKKIIQCNIRDITGRKQAEGALRESENQLRADLDAMKLLQRLGMLYIHKGNLEPILTEVVDAAITITGADFGTIQLVDPGLSELRIAAQRGFPNWWLNYWNTVSKGKGTCGTELLRGERVIIEDIEQSAIFAGTPVLDIHLRAGVRAVQSTPLMSREGKPLGMFSTHFKAPHRPDDHQLRLLDLLARQAADIIERAQSEEMLLKKNAALNAAYEEITSNEEELRQNIDELSRREQDLNKVLAEKEVLLSEVHHRVKNNLTAFISLLSLDGSYEDTQGGRALRKDLQNRARSMALIHETLYRTGKFSNVDMGIYLNNLVSQIADSYGGSEKIRIVVDVHDVALDLARATTAGLIINELVTNSFKYAFPMEFECMSVRGETCMIRVSLYREDGADVLTVADNGCGLPEGLDPLTTKSLGLKLVTFLARHQLRAKIDVRTDKGTEFIFHLEST